MSQKSTGKEVNGKLLTPENQAYLADMKAKGATPQFIQTETARLDKTNRSMRGHNRLVRAGQVASAVPLAMAAAPGGVLSAGGLGGGGGAAAQSSMGALATGAPASGTFPAGTMAAGSSLTGGGTLAATPFTALTPYAATAPMVGTGATTAGAAAASVANAANTIGSMGVGAGGPGAGAPLLTSSGLGGVPIASAGSNMVTPAMVASGQGSSGSMLANLLHAGTGSRFNNILKAGELATGVGTGIWAAKKQAQTDQAATAAQLKIAEDEMQFLRDQDEKNRLKQVADDAEAKRRWDLEQLQKARDSEESRLKWEDVEARRGPGRTAGYNALARLQTLHGLGDIGPMPTRTLPVYRPSALSSQPYGSTTTTGGAPTADLSPWEIGEARRMTPQPGSLVYDGSGRVVTSPGPTTASVTAPAAGPAPAMPTTPKPHPSAVWDPVKQEWIVPTMADLANASGLPDFTAGLPQP